jgi:hypothetical protein
MIYKGEIKNSPSFFGNQYHFGLSLRPNFKNRIGNGEGWLNRLKLITAIRYEAIALKQDR